MTAMPAILNLSRRGFAGALGLAAASFVLGIPREGRAAEAEDAPDAARFGAMLTIDARGLVRLIVPSSELGQGTQEALARMVAEELECDWAALEVELPWADPAFANPFSRKQMTANSTSVMGYYTAMRTLGAATRMMLTRAAAQRLGADEGELVVSAGTISHSASGRSLGFGEVARAASSLPVPAEVPLKPVSEFRIIGSASVRKDLLPKVNGSAEFGIDVREEGMLVGVPVLAPHPHATFDPAGLDDARARPGVRAVVPVTGGVVVVADRFWRAKSAAEAITLTVTSSPIAGLDDDTIRSRLREAFTTIEPRVFPEFEKGSGFPGRPIMPDKPAVEAAFAQADRVIEAEYEVPFLAHATLEPICCAARMDATSLFVRGPLQDPESARALGARLSSLPLEDVRVELTYVGGGFGRKWGTDFVGIAIEAAKGVPGQLIKTIWPREQDMAFDQYRPAFVARSRAALAKDGRVAALRSAVAGQSIMAYHGRGDILGDMADPMSAGKLVYDAYAEPLRYAESHRVDKGVPVGFWRSVSLSQNSFFMESFIDEIALETRQDPLQLRLRLLDGHPRITPVLTRAAEMIGLDAPRPEGTGRGIALAYTEANFCAVGIEVALSGENLSLTRIACACDCGLMIDPVSVEGQVSGGIVFGLQAALWGEVHFADGAPTAQNFSDYRLPMMMDVPPIEVALMPGSDQPGNVGEASTPAVAPALANAIVDAGGPRIRALPISRTLSI